MVDQGLADDRARDGYYGGDRPVGGEGQHPDTRRQHVERVRHQVRLHVLRPVLPERLAVLDLEQDAVHRAVGRHEGQAGHQGPVEKIGGRPRISGQQRPRGEGEDEAGQIYYREAVADLVRQTQPALLPRQEVGRDGRQGGPERTEHDDGGYETDVRSAYG